MLALATKIPLKSPPVYPRPTSDFTVKALRCGEETEVLEFLAQRPIHTVIMASMIRDNGLDSPLNRGSFYGCRNEQGVLEGVALIGHVTMIETQDDAVIEAFARTAQNYERAHVILGEQEKMERFAEFYGPCGQLTRLMNRELLLEQTWPVGVKQTVSMRRATMDDIELIVPVHAQMAFEESGVNPLDRDPEGFRKRVARRIEQGRTWVWTEGDRLIFKADEMSKTPEAIYLEGIYVHPDERGKGLGPQYLSQLSRELLQSTKSICLLVKEEDQIAQSCYRKAGYKVRAQYDTVFLESPSKDKERTKGPRAV
jgi:predicted GNAT family acetyltransferase